MRLRSLKPLLGSNPKSTASLIMVLITWESLLLSQAPCPLDCALKRLKSSITSQF